MRRLPQVRNVQEGMRLVRPTTAAAGSRRKTKAGRAVRAI
jgi:hypothetical protein